MATRKATARKTAKKKPAAKKVKKVKKVAKKKPAAKKAKPASKKKATTAIKKALSKSELFQLIADENECPKKQVAQIFESMTGIIERHLKKTGAGEFTIPGIAKVVTRKKPATKARKGVNPFTGEEMMFKAKPARMIVKVRPLKKLKEMAEG